MHLMYYLSESGERVYTLKARAAAAPAICCAATDCPSPLSRAAEGDASGQAHRVGAPGAVLARRQILEAPHHLQAPLRAAAHAEGQGAIVATRDLFLSSTA